MPNFPVGLVVLMGAEAPTEQEAIEKAAESIRSHIQAQNRIGAGIKFIMIGEATYADQEQVRKKGN